MIRRMTYRVNGLFKHFLCNHFSEKCYFSSSTECSNLLVKEVRQDIAIVDDGVGHSDGLRSSKALLEPCETDLSDVAPYHAPSFNFAAYVNKSKTLQQLVNLGVDLSKIEKKPAAKAILQLNFEEDIQKYIRFLLDFGVPVESLGEIFTKAPHFLLQDLENIQVRLNYLESKQFEHNSIVRIIEKNPHWLTCKIQDIDYRLGYFQLKFSLSGDEVRFLSTRSPKLITFNLKHVEVIRFSVLEEMGFSINESKSLLLNKPKIYTTDHEALVSRFDYLHNTMKIPQEYLAKQPDGLTHRKHRMEERHEFLVLLNKNQYDPTKPCYVSVKDMLKGTDVEFCRNVAKVSIDVYNKYLKTR